MDLEEEVTVYVPVGGVEDSACDWENGGTAGKSKVSAAVGQGIFLRGRDYNLVWIC